MWRAIADITQQLPERVDRATEVRRRCGLAMPQYASLTDQPNAGLRPLPPPSTGTRAASTPAVATQPCVAPARSAAATAPPPGMGSAAKAAAQKRTAAAGPLTDARVTKLQRLALNIGYRSHTARYHDDGDSRQQCEEHGHPEWLQFQNGRWILGDGTESYYYQ